MQDTITSRGDRVTINTGAGNNSLSSTGAQVIINAGGGNDTIYNAGSDTKIYAGGGDDYVENDAPNVTVSAGAGNDKINSTANNVKIDGGAGYDFVTSAGDNATIENAEEVTISGTGNLVKMKGGDIIFGFESDTGTIQADFVSAAFREQDVILTDAHGDEITIAGAKNKPININGVETVISAVCQNTSTGEEFSNISEALTCASPGDTLKLLKDVNENVYINIYQGVTFAGPGTYSGNLTLEGAGVTVGDKSLPVSSGYVYTSFDGTNFGNIVSDYAELTNNTPNITITENQSGDLTNNADNVSVQTEQYSHVTNTGDNVSIQMYQGGTFTNNGDNVSIQTCQDAYITNTGAAATILVEGNTQLTNSGANVSISALNGGIGFTNTAADVTIKVADNAAAYISSSDYTKTNVQLTYSEVRDSDGDVIFYHTGDSTKEVILSNAKAKVICVNGNHTMYGAAVTNSTASVTVQGGTTTANNASNVMIKTGNDVGANKTVVSAGDKVSITGTYYALNSNYQTIRADGANVDIYGRGDKARIYTGSYDSLNGGTDRVCWTGDSVSVVAATRNVGNSNTCLYATLKGNSGVVGLSNNNNNINHNYLYIIGNNNKYDSAAYARAVTIVGDSNSFATWYFQNRIGPSVVRGNYNTLHVSNSSTSNFNFEDAPVTISGNNNNLKFAAYNGTGNPRIFVESGANNSIVCDNTKDAFITFKSNTSSNVIVATSGNTFNHTISGWKADDWFYTTSSKTCTRSGNVITVHNKTFTLQNYSGSVKCKNSVGSYYYI